MSLFDKQGPKIEIKRGSWEERLRAIDAEARAQLPAPVRPDEPPRWALVIEPDPKAGALVAVVKPLLGEDVFALQGREAPLKLSGVLPKLLEAHEREPFVGICVVGTGDREDGRRAGWDLGPLAERPWVFAHSMTPPSGLVPTVGEKVVRYLDVIEGAAFMEGPKRSAR